MKKKKVILDINETVDGEIKALKETIGVSTNTELVRSALGLLDCIVEYRKEGYTLMLKKGDEVVTVAFPMLGLSK